MPIPCQGFTFTYAGTQLAEIRTLDFEYVADEADGARNRNGGFISSDRGTIVLQGTSPQGMSNAQYRYGGTLTINCPAGTNTLTVFQGYCVFNGMSVRAVANEAISFAYKFRVWSVTKALKT